VDYRAESFLPVLEAVLELRRHPPYQSGRQPQMPAPVVITS
jgi:hypothetical protein